MQCGGMKKATKMKKDGVKKMKAGGSTLSGSAIKKAPTYMYGMPQENMGTSGQYGMMKKGGAKKSLSKAQMGKAVRSVDTNKYGSTGEVEKTNKKGATKVKTVEISNTGSSMTNPSSTPTARIDKSKYNKEGMSTKGTTKDISVKRAQRMINRIGSKTTMKKGGAKKPLRKAQDGMTSGPMTKSTVDYLDQKYPGTAMRFRGPVDPEWEAEQRDRVADTQGATSWGRASDLEKNLRDREEGSIRSTGNRESFNTGDEYYKKGGAKKSTTKKPLMKKGGSIKTAVKKMAKGGSKFGMLSVKAGVDNNPKPTAADRIAGAKMSSPKKAKFGATVKVQRSPKAGKVTAVGRGYAAVGKREPGRIIKKTISKKK